MRSRQWLVTLTLCTVGFLGAIFTGTATLTSPGIARATMEDRLTVATGIPASRGAIDLSEENVDVDFYGNEVSAAVARYKVDPSGVIYEEHSPQTEVPRLASPKS